ncbi:MAG TPA: flagellar biosynthetic protein FliQ [Gammaproteobacteria bacterium]|nr:flagellar biosynthetic protein FliQ [Gammaproteobacteria bacterium]
MPVYATVLRHALELLLLGTLPVLGTSLAVGVVVGVLQSLLQLNDPTFSLAPKLILVFWVVLILGGWMLGLDGHLLRVTLGHVSQWLDMRWS